MIHDTTTPSMTGLPDPDLFPEIYADTVVKRFFAWIVDTVAITLISILAIPFTAFVGLFLFAGLFVLVSLVYRIASLAHWSATPGMRLMAMEIRARDGGPLDLPTAALHTIGYLFMSAVVILQAISIILMLTSPRGQGLHDQLLGTAPVNRHRMA
ncbi:RDD family protein [Meridianimarinicoccus sp. RP-17]|uniref:RDD family protein n=1 Tax=Meridianimarinicoccus zhengii TaxID=2056810 RepID=UPI001F1D65B9|nr:RDD family protein [Phycocomes zhengii]